ncbi:hypothetical protein L1887_30563 [Cichorium endivia]|nr:hypothetical protein L1887_30563 [Cichorium endivia]
MTKTLSSLNTPPPAPPPMPPSMSDNPYPTKYWCYQCDKRVPIRTLPDQPDVICFECKNRFVELISTHHPQALEAVCDDDVPPLLPSDRTGDYIDHLRIELDEWDENDDEIAMDMMIKKMNMRSRRGR